MTPLFRCYNILATSHVITNNSVERHRISYCEVADSETNTTIRPKRAPSSQGTQITTDSLSTSECRIKDIH